VTGLSPRAAKRLPLARRSHVGLGVGVDLRPPKASHRDPWNSARAGVLRGGSAGHSGAAPGACDPDEIVREVKAGERVIRGRNEPVGLLLGSLDAFVLMALYVVVVAAEIVALVTLDSGNVELWRRDFVGAVVLGLLVFIGFGAVGLTPPGSDDPL
jgi:hypothetical protein